MVRRKANVAAASSSGARTVVTVVGDHVSLSESGPGCVVAVAASCV